MKLFNQRRQQLTADDVEREIQFAIDDAWERSRNDPVSKAHWDRLFPDGKKPSQEEFIRRMAQELRDRQAQLYSIN